MKKSLLLVTALLLAQLLVASPTQAATPFAVPQQAVSYMYSVKFPLDMYVYVPCALGGQGEDVLLSGNLHALFHLTFDANGGFQGAFNDNPQGVSGVGSASGIKYQGTGVSHSNFTGKIGSAETFVNNFRIIGQGAGGDILIHDLYHVNGNGTVTADVGNVSAECE
jgi:hypothetical protein